jgi:TatD family-associated radical SAM protein
MPDSSIKMVYRFENGVYLNITNRCPNLCAFCIKTKWQMDFHGNNLNLSGAEPSTQEVIGALEAELSRAPFERVVFCGYGEPTMRMDVLLEVGKYLKDLRASNKYPPFPVRLNTNGMGNLVNGRNIVPELREVIDCVNVSLNAESPAVWQKIVRPQEPYKNGYISVLDFLKKCVDAHFESVVASCVENSGADPQGVKKIAEKLGAQFYLRSAL